MIERAFWAGKRVLVTGHTGFKGGWLTAWLRSLGARVAGYALAPATDPALWGLLDLDAEIEGRLADVRDAAALERAVGSFRPEIVFHLAAQSLVRPSYQDPAGTYAVNVMGTVHLLEAVRKTPGVRVVVNVTSDKCYENRGEARGYREDDPMGGADPYSSSKGCAELVTAAYRSSFFAAGGPALASVRAGNVIGGGDWALDRLVPDFVRAAVRREPLRVRNPASIRPWQHVLEPLSGYLLLAQRLWREPSGFASGWNFGPDARGAQPVEAVASRLASLWGEGAAWQADPGPHPAEARLLMLDSAKARARLGWKPRLAIDEALAWTVDWYRAQAAGENGRALCLSQIADYERLLNR